MVSAVEANGQGPQCALPSWHACTVESALADIGASFNGLSAADAAARLQRFGLNSLAFATGRGPLQRVLTQLANPLIYVLLGSALVSALLGHAVDTAVILAVVLINAAIGFVQEGRAEKALEAIRRMVSPMASVLRDGRRLTVDAAAVVPGDIMLLEAGDRIAADVRLIKSRNLFIDESILTGESAAVEKAIPALKRADVGVAMGRKGTEAAKEAAEMVLADDNFASIVAAVREGRAVYDNLIKVIGWTLPTSGGETLVIILAILVGLTLPVTPVQILWIKSAPWGWDLCWHSSLPSATSCSGHLARPMRRYSRDS